MTTPCADPSNDPNDWFIGRDGKQYGDEEFLTANEIHRIALSVLVIQGETEERHAERVDRAITIARNDRKTRALQKRRHAKEACSRCDFREGCLLLALKDPTPATHGTWGGLYEEELVEVRRRRTRRKGRP